MLGVTGRNDSVESPDLFAGGKTRLLLSDNVQKMVCILLGQKTDIGRIKGKHVTETFVFG